MGGFKVLSVDQYKDLLPNNIEDLKRKCINLAKQHKAIFDKEFPSKYKSHMTFSIPNKEYVFNIDGNIVYQFIGSYFKCGYYEEIGKIADRSHDPQSAQDGLSEKLGPVCEKIKQDINDLCEDKISCDSFKLPFKNKEYLAFYKKEIEKHDEGYIYGVNFYIKLKKKSFFQREGLSIMADNRHFEYTSSYDEYLTELQINKIDLDSAIDSILEATPTPTVDGNNDQQNAGDQGGDQSQQQNNGGQQNQQKKANIFAKILKTIGDGLRSMWNKLSGKAIEVMQQKFDAEWFNQNKNLILNNKFKTGYAFEGIDCPVAMERINKVSFPDFVTNKDLYDICNQEDGEIKLAQKLLDDAGIGNLKLQDPDPNGVGTLAQQFKKIFYGFTPQTTEDEMKQTKQYPDDWFDQNKNNMYEYCANLGNMKNDVKKGLDMIEKNEKFFEDMFKTHGDQTPINKGNESSNQDIDSAMQDADKISGNARQEGALYEAIAGEPDNQPTNSGNQVNSGVQQNTNNSADRAVIERYSRVTRDICAARLTGMMKIYNEYVQILNEHVVSYNGKPNPRLARKNNDQQQNANNNANQNQQQ